MNFIDLFRRIKYGKPIIVVSGLPRSGTSMIMKMLTEGGIETVSDGIRTSDIHNPKGYYELEKIKELDKGEDKSWLTGLRGKGVKIVSNFLKDLPGSNNYKVIFIERNLLEIIASQNKMLADRGEPAEPANNERMLRNFEGHLLKTKKLLKDKSWFNVLYIDHGEAIKNPYEQAKRIARFLGKDLNKEKMAGIVDPDLYRNRV